MLLPGGQRTLSKDSADLNATDMVPHILALKPTGTAPFQKLFQIEFLPTNPTPSSPPVVDPPPPSFISALQFTVTQRTKLGVPLQILAMTNLTPSDEEWFREHIPRVSNDTKLPGPKLPETPFYLSDEW
jgi:hypothetical protein